MSGKIGGDDAAGGCLYACPIVGEREVTRCNRGGGKASVRAWESSLHLSHQQSLETKPCSVQEAAGQE